MCVCVWVYTNTYYFFPFHSNSSAKSGCSECSWEGWVDGVKTTGCETEAEGLTGGWSPKDSRGCLCELQQSRVPPRWVGCQADCPEEPQRPAESPGEQPKPQGRWNPPASPISLMKTRWRLPLSPDPPHPRIRREAGRASVLAGVVKGKGLPP